MTSSMAEQQASGTAFRSSIAAELPVQIAPSIWIDSLDGLAEETTLHRWVSQPRFQRRLRERLQRRHGLIPAEDLPARNFHDQMLCRLDTETLPRCIRAAGVIAHASAVAREIHAPRVAALKQRLGPALYALALSHRDNVHHDQPHRDDAEGSIGEDLDAFEAKLEHDGKRCLLAWASAQPAALRDWLILGWLGPLSIEPFSDEPFSEEPFSEEPLSKVPLSKEPLPASGQTPGDSTQAVQYSVAMARLAAAHVLSLSDSASSDSPSSSVERKTMPSRSDSA